MNRSNRAKTILGCLAILIAASVLSIYFILTKPKAKMSHNRTKTVFVNAHQVQSEDFPVRITGMGVVIPANKVTIQSEVTGRVIEKSNRLIDGSIFKAGEVLVRLDSRDYQAAYDQAVAKLADARYALKLELGNQQIAKEEWDILNSDQPVEQADSDLALRKPHLARVRAQFAAARSAVAQAKLNLERTVIKAPFDGFIQSESVAPGQLVTMQTPLATFVASDSFYVKVSIPVDRLKWIDLPNEQEDVGARAVIIQDIGRGDTIRKNGRVIRLMGDLDTQGRMARVLVEVPDPLDLTLPTGDRHPLLLGAYVKAEIQGHILRNIITLPRAELHHRGTVWVLNSDSELEIRTVHVVWTEGETLVIDEGLQSGDWVITSNLQVAVPGMKLELVESGKDNPDDNGDTDVTEGA